MSFALVALGANLGDRAETLRTACRQLEQHPQVSAIQPSDWLETAPVGGPAGQQPFLNGAALLETTLAAEALHDLLHEIESELGRQRRIRWDARMIDLDLLLFDEAVLRTSQLTLPHPRMTFRRFVLEPAQQVAPEMRHPTTGWTVTELLANINRVPRHVVIAGGEPVARACFEEVGRQLAQDDSSENSDEIFSLRGSKVTPGGEDEPRTTLIATLGEVPRTKRDQGCPTLLLDEHDLDNAVRELLAAIKAMR